MLNLGGWEMAIVVIAALLLLGPQKLPEFARLFGRAIREVRKTTQEVRDAIDFEIEKEELNRLKEEFQASLDPIEQEIQGTVNDIQQGLDVTGYASIMPDEHDDMHHADLDAHEETDAHEDVDNTTAVEASPDTTETSDASKTETPNTDTEPTQNEPTEDKPLT